MVLGFQPHLLWFPDYERFGFQGPHAANRGDTHRRIGRYRRFKHRTLITFFKLVDDRAYTAATTTLILNPNLSSTNNAPFSTENKHRADDVSRLRMLVFLMFERRQHQFATPLCVLYIRVVTSNAFGRWRHSSRTCLQMTKPSRRRLRQRPRPIFGLRIEVENKTIDHHTQLKRSV